MNSQSEKTCTQNPVVQHLASVLLFTSTDIYGEPLEDQYSFSDFISADIDKLYTEFQQFIDQAENRVTEKVGGDWDTLEDFYLGQHSDGCVERDYIYTRNYEGTGFWEKGRWDERVSDIFDEIAKSKPEICCCVGDDGKLHIL